MTRTRKSVSLLASMSLFLTVLPLGAVAVAEKNSGLSNQTLNYSKYQRSRLSRRYTRPETRRLLRLPPLTQSTQVEQVVVGDLRLDTFGDEGSRLHERATKQPLMPKALVIRVPEELKILADDREIKRYANNVGGIDVSNFRFYRPNEAYDPRFPDVVYLVSR